MARLWLLLFVGLVPLLHLSAGPQEQTHFSAEDEHVRHPIALPEAVLALIAKDPDVMDVLKYYGLSRSQLPTTWLSASEVHLDGPSEMDIIVVAEGPLSGANVTTFWILRRSGTRIEVLLKAPAHDLIVKRSRSKGGYRDIEAWSATAVTESTLTLKFDGNQYKPSKRTSKPSP